MIPNFKPNKWDKQKIIDYVIGEQPLDDQQLSFLNYFERLEKEHDVLNEFEKWLEDKMNFYKNNFQGYSYERYKEVLDKLQELKKVINNE